MVENHTNAQAQTDESADDTDTVTPVTPDTDDTDTVTPVTPDTDDSPTLSAEGLEPAPAEDGHDDPSRPATADDFEDGTPTADQPDECPPCGSMPVESHKLETGSADADAFPADTDADTDDDADTDAVDDLFGQDVDRGGNSIFTTDNHYAAIERHMVAAAHEEAGGKLDDDADEDTIVLGFALVIVYAQLKICIRKMLPW